MCCCAIHLVCVMFALGFFVAEVVCDVIGWMASGGRWMGMSFWMIAAGIIGGLAAAVFGLIDFLAIPSGTRAKAIGMWHGLGNLVVVLLFAVSWALRRPDPIEPGEFPVEFSWIGVGLALITGWLGGELVERMGVGVDTGAHLNAPNSLSGRPAGENERTMPRAT